MLLISHFISHFLFIAAKNSNGKKGRRETNDEKAAKKSVLKKGEKNDEKKSKGR